MKELNELLSTFVEVVAQPKPAIAVMRTNIAEEVEKVSTRFPEYIKIGNLAQKGNTIPALLPFANTPGFVLHLNNEATSVHHLFLQNLAFSVLKKLPISACKLHLVDMHNFGADFSALNFLNDYSRNLITDAVALRQFLTAEKQNAYAIVQKFLGYTYPDLETYNEHQLGNLEPYRLLLISDFPKGFSREMLQDLSKLIDNSKKIGFKVLMTYDASFTFSYQNTEPKQIVEKLLHIIPDNSRSQIANFEFAHIFNEQYELQLDAFHQPISMFDFGNELAVYNKNFQQEYKSDKLEEEGISIPIGREGNKTHYFEIGYDSAYKESPHHAIIGGQSGKGKSVLLNNIILRGMEFYASQKLKFVLLDCKGTGFQEYKNLPPHIELLRITSQIEEAIEVIYFIDEEFKRREALFNAAGASNILQYRKNTGNDLPRFLFVIDEFQVLFTGSMKQTGYVEGILLNKVIKIGRSYGIHLIVSTQTLGDGVKRSILDNIPLRIALGMTADQSDKFLGLGNKAASNLPKGYAIYNAENGEVNFNKKVKVDFIDETQIQKRLSEVSTDTTWGDYL